MVTKHQAAVKAIHRLLVQGRMMAHEGFNGQEFTGPALFDFFDHLEYLPALLLETGDSSQRFGEYLEATCQQYHCAFIFSQYDNSPAC